MTSFLGDDIQFPPYWNSGVNDERRLWGPSSGLRFNPEVSYVGHLPSTHMGMVTDMV